MCAGILSSRPAHCFTPAPVAECCWQSVLCHPDGANVPRWCKCAANPTLQSSAIKMLRRGSGKHGQGSHAAGAPVPSLVGPGRRM